MSEDTLVLIFVAVMAVVLIIVFAFVKKRIGQMPKLVQERYEGKIKAECKVRDYYCFVTDDVFVIQNDKNMWYEFPFEQIGFVSGGNSRMKMSGYSMNLGNLHIYGKDEKILNGKIVSNNSGRMLKGKFVVGNVADTTALKDFVLDHVPGVQEK